MFLKKPLTTIPLEYPNAEIQIPSKFLAAGPALVALDANQVLEDEKYLTCPNAGEAPASPIAMDSPYQSPLLVNLEIGSVLNV